MRTNSIGFIVVFSASVLLGSCDSRRSTNDGSTTSAASQSATQTGNESEGMDLVHRGLALVSTGQALMEKDRIAMDGEHMDGEHMDGEHMTDDMSMIHQGMGMMSQGKDMAGKGMGPMSQNSSPEPGTMDKRMMAQGMAMMEKGMAMTEQCCGGKMKNAPMNKDSSGKAPMPAAPAMGDDKPMPKDTSMQDDM